MTPEEELLFYGSFIIGIGIPYIYFVLRKIKKFIFSEKKVKTTQKKEITMFNYYQDKKNLNRLIGENKR